jgi:NitT/TauT family transport system ATP-binding protein
MAKIVVRDVSKTFGGDDAVDRVPALERVSLDLADEEIVCLVGPSGCGKTTLLNIIAGFEQPTTGEVSIDGAPIRGAGPDRIVVFQTPALFPWMTVSENVTFGPRKRGVPAATYGPAAARYLAAVGLEAFARHYPYQLSGGMRQRVQLARALVNRPDVLLMDEPFVALDFQTRLSMQELLLRIATDSRATILFITHDVEEAVFLADRVYVMTKRPGRLREEIVVPFGRPRSYEVVTAAAFVAIKDRILHLIRDEMLGDRAVPPKDQR